MAKKKRNRIWWFPMTAKEYEELKKERKLPRPINLFDNQSMAYAQGWGNRFDPKFDENGQRVVVDGFQQLTHSGKVVVMGIHGEYIDWKKNLTTVRGEPGTGEMIFIDQDISLLERVVYQVVEESDEQLLRHLQSPMAKAGGIVPSPSLILSVRQKEDKRAVAAAAAAQAKEAASNGEDAGPTTDAASS